MTGDINGIAGDEIYDAGAQVFDYDNDGDRSVLSNGNPDDLITSLHGEVTYEEPLILFHRMQGWETSARRVGRLFLCRFHREAWRWRFRQ